MPIMSRAARAVLFCALVVGAAGLLSVTGCALLSAQETSNISAFLAQLSNTVSTDLTNTEAVANAATPPDTAGYTCAAALLTEQGVVNKVLAVNSIANSGAISAAELASLLTPGSAQMNAIRDAIVQGCAVKVAQTTSEIAGGAAWFTQLGVLFQLAPAL